MLSLLFDRMILQLQTLHYIASDYPIHSGTLEGVNNKINVIKRKAYGYHDLRYFSLKIIQAFAN
jgi:transposase